MGHLFRSNLKRLPSWAVECGIGNCVFAAAALATLLSAGCASNHSAVVHRAATTNPADVSLANAKSIDDLQSTDIQVNLTDMLERPQAIQTVYFGEADAFSSGESETPAAAVPLIAIKLGDDWKAVPLVGPALVDAGWKYVGAGPARHEVWGVLDTSAGKSRDHFVIVHSTDGALTFAIYAIKKPCRLATVYDFAMSRNGYGRVTLTLDAECGSYKAGMYHYDTIDGGHSWSKIPRYEPDAMIRAKSVPDDDQPDRAKAPSNSMLKASIRPSQHSLVGISQ